MHEIAIAEELVKMALSKAAEQGSQRISMMYIKLGEGSHIEPESLEFCLQAAAKGTSAEGALLKIEKTSGRDIILESLEVECEE